MKFLEQTYRQSSSRYISEFPSVHLSTLSNLLTIISLLIKINIINLQNIPNLYVNICASLEYLSNVIYQM